MLAYFRGASIILFGSVYYRQLPYDLLGLFASRIFPLLLLAALVGGGHADNLQDAAARAEASAPLESYGYLFMIQN